MPTLILVLLFIICFPSFAAVGDRVSSQTLLINNVRVQLYQGDAYLYFSPVGNDWSTPDCPGTKFAYIKESEAGANSILSVALTAKMANTPVKFTGICGDISGSLGYMRITDISM
ncbi:hypothetical protein CWB99_21870 [Pseudoalteromonas rubra]|uniref:Uncharacterized protein n=1 Tax=Pseudoalteromonas rubra TaxID=43658 RepID=A0A5S3WGK7_9GAMM|nr:hypothetical protein [Pseudoalteromonas rubra]TMP24659.1 hypothetical protein CWB99_21870 [Pseudoalteromonas rubra]TMP36268.1 hypothetical protein CWC00_02155 [Pseudoalteromonas rubra]